MQRKQIHFPLSGVAKAHSLDDLQRALIMDAERALNALWPDNRRAPAAMHDLHDALCLLIDWTSRTNAAGHGYGSIISGTLRISSWAWLPTSNRSAVCSPIRSRWR